MYNQIVLSLGTLCAPELRLEQELVNADHFIYATEPSRSVVRT